MPSLPSFGPTPTPAEAAPADPLGRDTPRGSFLGFLKAAQSDSFLVAADFLQLTRVTSKESPEEIVKQVKFVLDRRFSGDVTKISQLPQGKLDDGLPPDVEKVGVLDTDDGPVDVLLVHKGSEHGLVWLLSSDTVRNAMKLYKALSLPEVESRLPAFLQVRVRAFPLWQLLAFFLAFLLLWGISLLVVFAAFRLLRLAAGRRSWAARIGDWKGALRGPLSLLLVLLLHWWFVSTLQIPVLTRFRYSRLREMLIVFGLSWLALRVIDLLGRRQLAFKSQLSRYTVLSLGRRLMQFLVVTVAMLVVLQIFDVSLTAWLAGIGVGGIALAFAAQKSLENVFGGFFVVGDRVVRLGDVCKIGPFQGEVEDITLYATRLRTLDRTLVHIPNGQLATEKIENLSRRDKFWFHPILGLRYETSTDQMQRVLGDLRGMLAADPRVEPETARVRFIRFGAYSLDIEVFAYVRVPTWVDFLAAQEELHLKIMSLVEKSGTDIAFPSQTSYLGKDRALGAWEEPPANRPDTPRT